MDKNKPNWIKIRNEYETTNISYRKLAEKYNVSFKTLSPRAKREAWTKTKEEIQDKIRTKTGQKSIEKISNRNARHIAMMDKVLDKVDKVLDDQLTKELFFGELIDKGVINHNKLAKMMDIIEKVQKGHRVAEDIIDAKDINKLDIDKQKLELEKQRLVLLEQKAGHTETEIEDDGFLEALKGTAKEVWSDDSED